MKRPHIKKEDGEFSETNSVALFTYTVVRQSCVRMMCALIMRCLEMWRCKNICEYIEYNDFRENWNEKRYAM